MTNGYEVKEKYNANRNKIFPTLQYKILLNKYFRKLEEIILTYKVEYKHMFCKIKIFVYIIILCITLVNVKHRKEIKIFYSLKVLKFIMIRKYRLILLR